MKHVLWMVPILTLACGTKSGPKGGSATGVAVISSDFKSTTVSLINPSTGALVQDDCINSGTVAPTLSLALSGDVALASAPQPGGELVLIDRTNSALDWVAPKTCTVTRQLGVGTGFYANPHDVAGISSTKAYVIRFETNPTPSGTPGANDQGDDVLIVNPTAGTITGRIDLAPYATQVTGATIEARPDRALLANGKVYVTLGNISHDFKTSGAGRVVVIDPSTDKVAGTIDLPQYKSCSGLDYDGTSKTLFVGCGGDYNDTLQNQTAQSALVLVDIGGSKPTIMKAIGGSVTGARPISASAFAFAGGNLAVAATYGDASGAPPDALWAINLYTGGATKVADASGSFAFGAVSWLPDEQHVLVTDASSNTPVVRVFDVSKPAAIQQVATIDANPKSGLPPRLIGWY